MSNLSIYLSIYLSISCGGAGEPLAAMKMFFSPANPPAAGLPPRYMPAGPGAAGPFEFVRVCTPARGGLHSLGACEDRRTPGPAPLAAISCAAWALRGWARALGPWAAAGSTHTGLPQGSACASGCRARFRFAWGFQAVARGSLSNSCACPRFSFLTGRPWSEQGGIALPPWQCRCVLALAAWRPWLCTAPSNESQNAKARPGQVRFHQC